MVIVLKALLDKCVNNVKLTFNSSMNRREWNVGVDRGCIMQFPGRRRRERPKRSYLDVVNEDIHDVDTREDEVVDQSVWRTMMGKAER